MQTEKGTGTLNSAWPGIKSTSTMGAYGMQESGTYKSGVDMHEVFSSQYDNQYGTQQYGVQFGGQQSSMGLDSRYLAEDSDFVQNWQTNGRYLQQVMFYS